MKILIIGDSSSGGIAWTFWKSLISMGYEADIVDEWLIYRKSGILFRNKYVHRFFWKLLAYRVQKKIFNSIIDKNPELVLILKGFIIHPNTIKKIKNNGCIIFNFNPDNPFNNWAHGNSNSWIIRSIPLFDCYFIWGKFLIEKLIKSGAKKVEYLPFGYDEELHFAVEVSGPDRVKFGSDIAFIGSWDKEREEWLNYLTDYDLKIWGNSWEKANKNLRKKWQGRVVVGEEFSKVCGAAKLNINIIRKQNESAHNMRTFEIPACGGFILSMRTDEVGDFFKEGEEAEYFSTVAELKKKIDFYLKNDGLRKKIAFAGHQKLLRSPYSYDDRAEKILSVFKSLKSKD